MSHRDDAERLLKLAEKMLDLAANTSSNEVATRRVILAEGYIRAAAVHATLDKSGS